MGRPSDARQRLVRAAVEEIFVHSYASVSVDELCAKAEVTKSSFYHFFASKRELALVALETYWQSLQRHVIEPTFAPEVPAQERMLRFFDQVYEGQRKLWDATGYLRGCLAGNLTLEMSAQDEEFRTRVESIFTCWTSYIEQAVREQVQAFEIAQGSTPDASTRALALLAYLEGVLLMAKSRNDPEVIKQLRFGVVSLLHIGKEGQATC